MIEILTAQEKSIMNMLGKTRAINTIHSTLLDTLDTPASAAVEESADYTAGVLSTPTRLTNLVEVVAKPFKVSRTQQAIEKYSGENELARQTTKALKNFGNSAEFDLVRSTLVSGASGTTPKMEGMIAHISKSTNTTAHNSGTVWSASIMKGLMKDNIDNSNGDVATDIFMGSFLKDKTDDFTNKSTNVVTGTNIREIVNAVEVFETGLGKLAVHYHRYVQQSADATARVLAIRPEKHKVAYLEEPYVDRDLARTGPYDFYAVNGSMTLETRNQDSNFFASGFDKD
jgi:hypothetical protein